MSAVVMLSARMTMTPCDLVGWMPCAASVVDRSAKVQSSYSLGLWVASRVSTVCVRTRRSPPIYVCDVGQVIDRWRLIVGFGRDRQLAAVLGDERQRASDDR